MPRMRGVGGQLLPHCPPRDCASKTPIKAKVVPCTTKYKKIRRSVLASSQVERVVPFNLLTAPTNVRIVIDAHIDCSSGNNSNETNNTYLEINEAMNIDSLIRDARKKRKTTARAVNARLPEARVIYCSATGASKPHNIGSQPICHRRHRPDHLVHRPRLTPLLRRRRRRSLLPQPIAMMRAQEADPINLEVLLALGVSHTNG
ncbi:hypothetical protein PVK06_023832 [Gossypium arboreum]|uniref:Strawberry notch AAA domain-containing protein n=1 Tax=Gossypium arboreum TaxID=29729 RepID=A0ABR0PCD7_GOSAR|nr:hypothetical protein PVK06_023832 [Gossypium arboreum]